MFDKILIANRGEIALRVIRTARAMGLKTVAVHSEADRGALHVRLADEAIGIGPGQAAQSYLSIPAILDAVRASGAGAVHPGYGFLSENAAFAEALAAEGVTFIGPSVAAIRAMGDKVAAKEIAIAAGISTVPGHMGLIESGAEAAAISRRIGYPVMVKAAGGGGGKGMRIATNDQEAAEGWASARSEAQAAFGDPRVFIEKFVANPRHIEIQILADSHGNVLSLHERECSVQRRHQKVVEEAPSPFVDAGLRAAMGAEAIRLARAVGYQSAGTVEFIVDAERNFYFLEMNTRLQVEHPVTELVTGVDLVEQMIRISRGEALALRQEDIAISGWAVESRVYAEDPYRKFLPSTGRLSRYRPPAEVTGPLTIRNDTGVEEGGEISMFYDPMIAKLCTHAPDRAQAVAGMAAALDGFEIEGIGHNLPFLSALMALPRFRAGDLTTGLIAEEWPEGFAGVALDPLAERRVAAAAAAMHRIVEIRRARISGRMDNHERRVGAEWVVSLQGARHAVTIAADKGGADVAFAGGAALRVVSDWRPGQTLARLTVDGVDMTLKVDPLPLGFRIRTGGADLPVLVQTPRQAELAALMPEKAPPDTSRQLLCPMPGQIVAVMVAEGDEVQPGQALVTVEAMKMENILRAEREGVIARIHVAPGATLRVDEIILEFAGD